MPTPSAGRSSRSGVAAVAPLRAADARAGAVAGRGSSPRPGRRTSPRCRTAVPGSGVVVGAERSIRTEVDLKASGLPTPSIERYSNRCGPSRSTGTLIVAVSRVTIAVWIVPLSIRYWICSTPAEPAPGSVPVSLTVTAPLYQPSAARRWSSELGRRRRAPSCRSGTGRRREMSNVSNAPRGRLGGERHQVGRASPVGLLFVPAA